MSGQAPSETTAKKHSGLIPFKPGQSGNPAGRPKGARHKLGTAFIEAMHKDFDEYGIGVIEVVRLEKPDQYLKVIASILPKEFDLGDKTADALTELLLAIDGRSKGLPHG